MNETQTNEPCLRLEYQLCFPLYACAKEVVRQYREPLKPLNLTYTQYIVMMVLWEFGEMTEGEIGKKVHLDSGTLGESKDQIRRYIRLTFLVPELLKLVDEGRIKMRPAVGHNDISTTMNIYTDATKALKKSEFQTLETYLIPKE